MIKVLVIDPPAASNLVQWAKINCVGFTTWEEVDVSDVSSRYDILGYYYFTNEKDALFFMLKWGGELS